MDLHIDQLACRRAGRQIFHGLEFALGAGQAAAVRGPNGAGKSTLLRVIAGLLPAAGGDVRLGEMSLGADRSLFQEHLAYAGHLDAVKTALTVRDNLAIWAAINGGDTARAGAALARFGLARIAARLVVECSAGQRRRLGLARLLVAEKPLWLLDEPTVSLDGDARALVAAVVREHLAAGGLALIATHEDLGLGPLPVLEIDPASAGTAIAGAADPFLEGTW
ncbi:MAG: heme ABC exporter ATP-binding protein CcmA [Pseudomonadota bacterium]